ncbi:MAG: helix-turn-helix transcriptional regulator [Planctomycetota bacterium]|nr:helix-turn-helix transcriptional regulator [Planctomycetota bacterium]
MPKHAPTPERALLDLCARVFQNPARLVQATHMPLDGAFALEPHAHRDLLQMDVAAGCAGYWHRAGGRLVPRAATAAVFYPGVEHGYAMRAAHPGAAIYSFKLRVERGWPALKLRLFPACVHELTGAEPLLRALKRVARASIAPAGPSPLLALAVAEALCLWPREAAGAGTPPRGSAGDEDARIERALALIDERLARPPGLEELAEAVHLSPRQLARVFAREQGCSPHAYATARRAARAKELLAQGRLNVTEVAEALGFPEIHTFSRWFRREAGVSPAQYRERPGLL